MYNIIKTGVMENYISWDPRAWFLLLMKYERRSDLFAQSSIDAEKNALVTEWCRTKILKKKKVLTKIYKLLKCQIHNASMNMLSMSMNN